MKKEIETSDDVKLLVNEFYKMVRQDELLAPIFNERIPGDWQPHLEIMYRFWDAILLGVPSYNGHPFAKHTKLPIDRHHFEQWIKLFYDTIDQYFIGSIAEEAKTRAMVIALAFYNRMHEQPKVLTA